MSGEERVKVWDIGVRLFHWSLVVLFAVAYVSGEEESLVHIYSGYGVIGLVAFRMAWGFVGTRHARFADFIYGPKAVSDYARSLLAGKPIHYLGHNPLGGWMVIALLVSLALTSWSGLELYGAEGQGPLAKQVSLIAPAMANGDDRHGKKNDSEGDEFWEEAHEVLANLSLLLVFVHIAGAVIASVMHRENLIKAMITGYKDIRKP